jgi:hypothetical protein
MSPLVPGSNRHFYHYYEDNSLLVQFIIVEFIQTHHLIFQIKTLIQNHLDSVHIPQSIVPSLMHVFSQLVGCLSQQERVFFSRWTKGSLTKLKEYCEQFARNSNYQNKQQIKLHLAAHQTWLAAIYYLELLYSLQVTHDPQSQTYFLLPLKRVFQTLQRRFNQVMRSIPHVMSPYCKNENVILCLLRKKAPLAKIYGDDFLYKSFKWSFEPKELSQLLIQCYEARGFQSILPMVKEILKEEDPLCETD